MKKRGLGKNLDVLLSRSHIASKTSTTTSAVATTVPAKESNGSRQLPIEFLQRGRYQPRREFAHEQLQELADSIRAQGIIQPIVVRPIADKQYEIIAGERRWRAAQIAGLADVPVVIKDISDNAALAMALIENIQREDLNPIEEAVALQRLAEEFSLTHQEVAEAVGKSRTTVTNLLRLLSLPSELRKLLEQGEIEMGHARALLTLQGPAQTHIAAQIVAKKLSVRETENLARKMQNGITETNAKSDKPIDPNIRKLQQDLSDQLGLMINFQHGNKGKGKMIIHYNNLDELEGILEKIQ